MDNYTKWTDEEWASVAKRAVALKAAKPEMPWTQIVPVCQDDIAPERRRFTINKLSGLKPMFDILDLDQQGSPKPPPEPEPEPQPEPAAVTSATPPFILPKLSDVPTDQLIAEVFSRASVLKDQIDTALSTKAAVTALLEENKTKLDLWLKRVDEVEGTALHCLDGMDKINQRMDIIMDDYNRITKLDEQVLGVMADNPTAANHALTKATEAIIKTPPPRQITPKMAPVRVLIVGVIEKELSRIKERLPRELNVELIHSQNSQNMTLPANIHYACVSGHNDCTRRWQTVRAHYGDKAHRMANGSIGSFVHAIEELCVIRG